jgi:hypothetical protein
MKIAFYLLVIILAIETYFLYSINKEKTNMYNSLQLANETQSGAYDSEVLVYIVYTNMLTNISEEISKNPIKAEKVSNEYICSVLPMAEEYIKSKLTKPEKIESLNMLLEKNRLRCKEF